MPDLVPSGYLTIREALNRLGHELFGSDWTGEEHKTRRGLISEDEWLRIKDLPPARGGGDALASATSLPSRPLIQTLAKLPSVSCGTIFAADMQRGPIGPLCMSAHPRATGLLLLRR